MLISYCTNCHNRLWQLQKTLEHNLKFLKKGEVELCILAYNDDSIEPFFKKVYPEYLSDKRVKIKNHKDEYKPLDGSDYACGYVKHLAHEMGSGTILFNLDADNYIGNVHSYLLNLKPNEILNNIPFKFDGRNGRIGIHKTMYDLVGGYEDKGRSDDGYFISKCLKIKGTVLKSINCDIAPISNIQENNQREKL